MVIENLYVNAEVIEIQEFPQLGREYGVRGVPSVINDTVSFTRVADENTLLAHIGEAWQREGLKTR